MVNPYSDLRHSLGRPLFIPFTVLGDPDEQTSMKIIQTLIENGADALELGLPYSDPPADGPVIQAADVRALQAGITVDDCFKILRSARNLLSPVPFPPVEERGGQYTFPSSSGGGVRGGGNNKEIKNEQRTNMPFPIGLLVYFNLVFQRGIAKFYQDCKTAGVTSVLIADLPLEHAEESVREAKANGIAPVFMVSALTTDQRLQKIADIGEGYLYVVSYLGVTGVENAVLESEVKALLKRVRRYTDLPLCVGFGMNTPEQVAAVVRAGADGVIVGSRIVKEVPDCARIATICREFQAAIHC